MDALYYSSYDEFATIILCLLVTGSLFFLMAGLRSIRHNLLEGLLFLFLGLFFCSTHFLYLFNLPHGTLISLTSWRLDIFGWLVLFLAPALILLYLLFGLINFLLANFRNGLIKIFFGLTLICYLYMLGSSWPVDVKGIITLLFSLTWFEIEVLSVEA